MGRFCRHSAWLRHLLIWVIAIPSLHAADWPGYRGGPARDGLSPETGLLKQWPEGGPKLLWGPVDVGKGHSSVVVVDGTLYAWGATPEGTFLTARGLEDGKLKWRVQTGRGEPSPTPSVADGKIIFQCNGRVYCHSAADGRPLWNADVMGLFPKGREWKDRTRYGTWHGSPVVALGKVFVVTGSPDAPVIALDQNTGQLVWASKGSKDASSRGWSSPAVVRHGTLDLLLVETAWHILGVDARDGTVLWEHELFADGGARQAGNSLGNIPAYDGGYVYATSGYGHMLWSTFKLSASGKETEKVWNNAAIHPYQENVICTGGLIFGSGDITWADVDANPGLLVNGKPFREVASAFYPHPAQMDPKNLKSAGLRVKDAAALNRGRSGGLVCQELATGKVLGVRYGIPCDLGFSAMMMVHAEGLLYGLWSWDNPTMYLIEARPTMEIRGRFTLPLRPEPPPADPAKAKPRGNPFVGFNSPVLCGGRLLVRYNEQLFAFDVRDPARRNAPRN